MKTVYLLLILCIAVTPSFCNSTIEGKVVDKDSKEPIIFTPVAIYINEKLDLITETDVDGNYLFLDVKPGNYIMVIDYIGYKHNEDDISIKDFDFLKVDVEMEEDGQLSTNFIGCCFKCTEKVDYTIEPIHFDNEAKIESQPADADLSQLDVFPNPTPNKIWIKSDSIIESVSVFGINGTMLYHKIIAQDDAEVDLSSLPDGTYFMNIGHKGKTTIRKVVKLTC